MGELILHVIGFTGVIVIVLVAAPAIGRRSRELTVHVTLRAVDLHMQPGEREIGCIMINRCGRPCRCGMADIASVRIVSGHVIRIGHALIISAVTIVA